MSLSKHKKMPTYDFPEEILSEIFKRLPVKYVLRCGAVQKSWYYLIRTPLFISEHCNYQKMTAHINPKYLLFHNLDTKLFTVRSDDAQSQEYCTFHYPLDLAACSWYAQSNGLICMSNMFDRKHGYDFNPYIYIWNPLVQAFKTVSDSPLSTFTFKETVWNALAFGFLPEVNDYVLVHIVKPRSTSEPLSFNYLDPNSHVNYEKYPHSVMIGVYSLNTDSWKEICQEKVLVDFMLTNRSVFVNGTAFWVGCDLNCQIVISFDTKTNILQKVMVSNWIPSALHQYQFENPIILPFGKSIAYFVEVGQDDAEEDDEGYRSSHLEIWVLKDDMIGEYSWDWEKKIWEKKMSVSLSENIWADVLGIRNNGDPILAKSNNLISYDLDTHEPYDFINSCDRLTPNSFYEEGSKPPFLITPFVETLLWLDID